MSCQKRTDGDEAVQGSEFRKSRREKGGNFCLGRGWLVKDISLRSAVLLGEWVRKEASGILIFRMCVCVGYLLFGRASVRISRAVFIVKSITINGKFIQPMEKKKESVSIENFFRYSFFSPSNSSSLSLSLFHSIGHIFQEMPWYACPGRASPPRRLSPSHLPPTRAGPP